MWDEVARTCAQCGAPLAPGRRFCLNCQAPVPGAGAAATEGIAALAREIPSTRRPDRTSFVPERREARLARGRRRRRLLSAAAVALLPPLGGRIRVSGACACANGPRPNPGGASNWPRAVDASPASLELFHADVGRYPTNGEGLAALLRRPEQAVDWRGLYIEGDYALDPWGNDYVYHAVNQGAGGNEVVHLRPRGRGGRAPAAPRPCRIHEGSTLLKETYAREESRPARQRPGQGRRRPCC